MRFLLQGFYIVFVLSVLYSCSNNKEERVYKTLDDGFTASYKLINRQSEMFLLALDNKKTHPATVEKAIVWYDKALAIRQSSEDMINYIRKIKTSAEREKRKAYEVYDSLNKYKQFVLNIDPLLKQEFYNNLILADSSVEKDEEVLQSEAAAPMLGYIQNNVAMAANRLIRFCNEQVNIFHGYDEFYSAIVVQNIKYARPGDQIEITAGVGAFKYMFDQKITIEGMNVPLDESTIAKYKIKAPNQIGKHRIPVRVEYKDQDGKLQSVTKEIEYEVIK
jgi:hypothetical protein